MKKLSVSRFFSIIFLLLSIFIFLFGKDYLEEAYRLWSFGEPNTLFYVESKVNLIDLKAGTLESTINGLGTFKFDLSFIEKYLGHDYIIGGNANVLCDADKNVLCLHSYYLNTLYFTFVLVCISLLSFVAFLISFIYSFFEYDEEDYYYDNDEVDLEIEEQLEDDYKAIIVEYKSQREANKVNTNSGGLYD